MGHWHGSGASAGGPGRNETRWKRLCSSGDGHAPEGSWGELGRDREEMRRDEERGSRVARALQVAVANIRGEYGRNNERNYDRWERSALGRPEKRVPGQTRGKHQGRPIGKCRRDC